MSANIDAKTFETIPQVIDAVSGQTTFESFDRLAEFLVENVPAVVVATPQQMARLIAELADHDQLLGSQDNKTVEHIFNHFFRRAAVLAGKSEVDWFEPADFEKSYRKMPAESTGRGQLLAALAAIRTDASLSLFADLVASDPPADERHAMLAFAPLVNDTPFNVAAVFPTLMEAIKYLHLAGLVMHLPNNVTRKSLVDRHPATERASQLTVLLGQVVQQLALIEEGKTDQKTPEAISQSVNESVSLTVSLCDALALANHQDAIGKICQAMDLKHRRVKTEAAAALVRLGDADEEAGKKQLIELASEAVARIRVISYAEELGIADEIADELKTESAIAESQLALWLAAPVQMGVAPTSIEVICQRAMRWPGFHEIVDCYLVRFEYRFAEQAYSNIGIVGPVTHAFASNLEHLSHDDVFAAYAGWQTEHEDIYTVEIEHAKKSMVGAYHSLIHRLENEFDEVDAEFIGMFFETPVMVARAIEQVESEDSTEPRNVSRIIVADRNDTLVVESGSPYSPITPELAFEIYKGRNLIQAFNDTMTHEA